MMAENTNVGPVDGENMEPDHIVATAKPSSVEKSQPSEVNIEPLLARNRSEIMYELRKMKHDMPVTKTKETTKKMLEMLARQKDARLAKSASKKKRKMAKRFEQATELTRQESDPALSEEVLHEVRRLMEQHRVTEFLQNEVEKEHLEQVLKGVIERKENEHQPRRSQRTRRRVQFADSESAAPPRLSPPRSSESSPSLPRSSVSSRDQGQQQQQRRRRYRMPHRDQSQILSQLRASPALNRMEPEQRDELVSEISNLVGRQLVTSTLSGEMRGVLELHIQERADRVNAGHGVDHVLQSLHRRNTYSREARETRSSYHDNDQPETYSELHSDIDQMKSQLREMKQMMRISFDLQMDIQRAIRQEVAAAMVAACNMQTAHVQAANFTSAPVNVVGATSTVTAAGQPTAPIASGQCIICLHRNIDSVIYRCGHMCVCITCGMELKGQNLKCPVCRAPITDIIRAYTSC